MSDAPKTYEGDDLLTWLENRTRFDHFAHTVEDGGDVLTSVHAPCENSKAAAERIRKAEARVERDRRMMLIYVEALAEIKATSDGNSDQPIARIINGCIAEIAAIAADTQEADHE